MYGRQPTQRDASRWAAIVDEHQQRKSQLGSELDSGSDGDKENSRAVLSSSPPPSLTRKRVRPPPSLPPSPPAWPTKTVEAAPLPASTLPSPRLSGSNAFTVLMGRTANSLHSSTAAQARKRKAESAGSAAKSARHGGSGGGLHGSSSSGTSEAGRAPQLFLDFGQALKQLTTCGECGFVYQSGLEQDEAMHRQRHDVQLKGIPFNGWQGEPANLLASLQPSATPPPQSADRLLRIDASHLLRHPSHAGKVAEIVARLDQQLGSARSSSDTALATSALLSSQLALYVYVRNRRVIAAMTVRSDVEAAPIVQSPSSASSYQLSLHGRRTASIGVEQIWVIDRHRRDGVASRMLDACRLSHVYVAQSRDDIAFSQPTALGRQLAQHYTGRQDFLAYA